MLDFHRLHPQLADFSTYKVAEDGRQRSRLERGLAALAEAHEHWETLEDKVKAAAPKFLVAGLMEAPGNCRDCGPRPSPVTVVATDGSQIYPDRHVEPTCYLLNVSRIAFHYGTHEPPTMEAEPRLRYRQEDLLEFEDFEPAITAELVSAFRDELELEFLLQTARCHRIPGRPIFAIADGTLIRWMLRAMQNAKLEQEMIARYAALLQQFRVEQLPVCSYISAPRNTELVNLLRVQCGECEQPPGPEATLEGLTDRDLYEHTLQPGQRSALFRAGSRIQRDYDPDDAICYFYLNVGREIGRVELPLWVARQETVVDAIHAVLLDQVEKGRGYPVILSEAHERAVIRAQDKELFYRMLERQLYRQGLHHYAPSQKQTSKCRPLI